MINDIRTNSLEPLQVITLLEPYLTDRRKQRIDDVLSCRIQSVQVGVEAVYDPHNAAAVIRTAEAFGALHTHFIDIENESVMSKGVTQGAFHWTQNHFYPSLNDFKQATSEVICYGAIMDGEYELSELPLDKPCCLLFGNENRGLSDAAKQHCDKLFRIPMYGMSESLNLSVSAAISLHETLKRKRTQLQQNSDLDSDSYTKLKASYYANSVKPELLEQLMKSAL